MNPTLIQIVATIIFTIAVLHTFSVKFFVNLAHKYPRHEKVFHLLGEVEAVFGFWAIILIILFFILGGKQFSIDYLNNQKFTEPLFVFVIMVIAASKPILDFSLFCVTKISKLLPLHSSLSFYFVTLSLVPLLGSFITEPAAMTLGALILKDHFYSRKISTTLMFATIGALFVNVSVGGVMTQFAAPPVLMVAQKWGWTLEFMFTNYGWRAAGACVVNALIVTFLFRNELKKIEGLKIPEVKLTFHILILHLALLAGVVVFVHDLIVFVGIFLIFLALATCYKEYQTKLIMREAFMVSLFLSGLVVLGAEQKWWLQPLLSSMSVNQVYYAAITLTSVTDNAALTYLGSLVDGLSDEFKFALVAGAVSGGGLTVIANAPNPAGYSILCKSFKDGVISPLYLFLGALGPTIIVIFFFNLI